MPTTSAFIAQMNNTNFTNFSAWAKPISDALIAFGFTRQNDTGQVVWVATILTCTSVAVSGGNAVYAYSGFTGPTPRIGMSFVFSTFGTAGNNVTAVVIAVNPGVSVTVATSTQVNDTTGSGTTTALAATPATGTYVIEVWKTADSVGFDVYIKMEYGTSTNAAVMNLFITIGTATNGAGTLVNPSTRMGLIGNGNTSATLTNCRISGDGVRLQILLWVGGGLATGVAYVYSLERSYDNSGVVTGSYYTICCINPSTSGWQQTLFPNGGLTVCETSGLMCVIPSQAATGNVGANTHVSPVFPVVGGIGNPMKGLMVFRGVDFANNQMMYATLYGVQHTYIIYGWNNTAISNTSQNCGVGVLFE
jgi:hypothetical protein